MKEMTFKDIQAWFGERGHIVLPPMFKKLGVDEDYIYWMPNNAWCERMEEDYLTSDTKNGVLWVSINNLWCEIEDEKPLKEMPVRVQNLLKTGL